MKHDIECANKSNLLVECFGQNLRNPVLVTQEKAEARDLLESNGLALFLVPEVTSSSLFCSYSVDSIKRTVFLIEIF